jgi:DNA processing protein
MLLSLMDKTHDDEQKFCFLAAHATSAGVFALLHQYRRQFGEGTVLDPIEKWRALHLENDPEAGARLARHLTQHNVSWITIFDAPYPALLKEIADPPAVLFFRGSLEVLNRPCVAIIGSRRCTSYGRGVATELAEQAARAGWTVVSGLATGIDGIAHGAALDARGLTAAVLGSGFSRIYPVNHEPLAKRIETQGGLLVSEFAPDTGPQKHHFPLRNRIVSGLCLATVVVEGSAQSGTLITARQCLEQNRELYAVPGPLHQKTFQGTNTLIERGEARLFRSFERFLEDFSHLGLQRVEVKKKQTSSRLSVDCQRVYAILDRFEPKSVAQILEETDLPPARLFAILTQLEGKKALSWQPGQRLVKRTLNEE